MGHFKLSALMFCVLLFLEYYFRSILILQEVAEVKRLCENAT